MEASEVKSARAQLEMYAQSEAEIKREVGQSLSIQKIPTERCVPQLSAERERLACTVAERDALKVLCLYPWLTSRRFRPSTFPPLGIRFGRLQAQLTDARRHSVRRMTMHLPSTDPPSCR